MKKIVTISFLILSMQVALAQVSKNPSGLYTNEFGTLFTGKLNQKLENSQSMEISVVNGKEEGNANYFYASGKLMEIGSFANGNKVGEWVRFSENGTKIAIANYLSGKKHGDWFVFDEKGNKLFEMKYENGEKVGNWKQYDIAGNLIHSYDYGLKN